MLDIKIIGLGSFFSNFLAIIGLSGIFLFVVIFNGQCQRQYYEYNNPEALKLNKKTVAMLTSSEWMVDEVQLQTREDTTSYSKYGTLRYRDDGTYAFGSRTGIWSIKYNHYLVHTDTTRRERTPGLGGIYSVTSLSDSTAVLTKLHSSSGDNLRRIVLTKKVKGGRSMLAKTVQFPRRLTSGEIDSLRFLSAEENFIYDLVIRKDTLLLQAGDSLYKIKMDYENPLRKVKLFDAKEFLPEFKDNRRFIIPPGIIRDVDSLAMRHIESRRGENDRIKGIATIDTYFRQYLGYFDENGDEIIFLNAFCDYKGTWQRCLIKSSGGGYCNFRIHINLSRQECYSFYVNDF